ncbi:MAG TPA: DUF4139 domain-containing protein [Planctomycetota bacterium]|nr:DUF4139 domain-containing protein [Planctomycetota bacterium]
MTAPLAVSANPVSISSRIERVTLYREGAVVERAAELRQQQDAWPHSARIGGLPLCLDDSSVRVRLLKTSGDAPLIACDLRVILDVPNLDSGLPPAENPELKAAEREHALLRERMSQIDTDIRRTQETPIPPRGREKDKPPPNAPTESRLEFLEFQRERIDSLLAQQRELEAQSRELERRIAHLHSQDQQRGSARAPREHELRKAVVVALRPGAASNVKSVGLVIEYRVPGARWAPAYGIHFDRAFTRGRLKMRALVAQYTGEDWTNVPLTLSTAAAQHWTDLPELKSLRIGRSQPPPARKGWRPPPDGADALFEDYLATARRSSDAWIDVRSASTILGVTEVELLRRATTENWPLTQHERLTLVSYLSVQAALSVRMGFGAAAGGTTMEKSARATGNTTMVHRGRLEETHMITRGGSAQEPSLNVAKRSLPPPPPISAPAPAPAAPAMSRVRAAVALSGSAPGGVKAALAADVPDGARRSVAGSYNDLSTSDIAAAPETEPPSSAPPALTPAQSLLDFGRLRLSPPEKSTTGALYAANDAELRAEILAGISVSIQVDIQAAVTVALQTAHSKVGSQPSGCVFVESHEGFDYAFRTPAPVSVPSDGQYHSLPLLDQELPAHARYVTVPRESQDVYRFVELANPLDAPLLRGPAEIHIDGVYLLTTPLATVAPKGKLALGLGVEQSLKVARNTRFAEATTGLIGGSLELRHEIEIELINNLPAPALLEVRERIPHAAEGEQEVKVVVGTVDPRWEELREEDLRIGETGLKGGYRWRLSLDPGSKQTLKAAYVLQTSSKNEIVGGNRREN